LGAGAYSGEIFSINIRMKPSGAGYYSDQRRVGCKTHPSLIYGYSLVKLGQVSG